jgi:hypothetical protein
MVSMVIKKWATTQKSVPGLQSRVGSVYPEMLVMLYFEKKK